MCAGGQSLNPWKSVKSAKFLTIEQFHGDEVLVNSVKILKNGFYFAVAPLFPLTYIVGQQAAFRIKIAE